MKKQIKVEHINIPGIQSSLAEISVLLDSLKPDMLDFTPWAAFPYKPEVSFVLAHTGDAILVKFYVKEAYTPVRFKRVNDPVFKDSCVEIFISFEPGKNYYNIEHNSSGACLAGYKEEGHALQLLEKKTIEQIRTLSVMKSCIPALNKQEWELTVVIPLGFFGAALHGLPLKGRTAAANFYKCGDDTPVPHYLSWNLVEAPSPDFHQPKYFGELLFL